MLFFIFFATGCGTPKPSANESEITTDTSSTTDGETEDSGIEESIVETLPRIFRLTHEQWENTVQQLLYLNEETGFSSAFIGSTLDGGFENNADNLVVGPQLFQDYQRAAESLSKMVIRSPHLYAQVVPQDPRENGGLTDNFFLQIEAESGDALLVPDGNGQAGADDFLIWSNAQLLFSVEIPASATYTISSYITGTDCGDGVGAAAELVLDGSTQTTGVGLSGEIMSTTVDISQGQHTLAVAFTNDCWNPDLGYDRNLRVDWLSVESYSVLGESSATQQDAKDWIAHFGRRAFRRPLSEDEIDFWQDLFTQAPLLFASGDDFADGVRLVIQAMLQMPDFLYRIETAEYDEELNAHELAEKLSYTLCNAPPDEQLAILADDGSVIDNLEQQTNRLLAQPCSRDTLLDFHRQILLWDNYVHNFSSDEMWSAELNTMMIEEVKAFVDHAIFEEDGGLHELLTANYTIANHDIAALYGEQGTTDFAKIELDPTQRAGLLTLSGFLTQQSDAIQSNPIHRGVFVADHILCATLPVPPDDITGLPAQQEGVTNRERVEAHTGEGTCGEGCHSALINPLGFGLENYDHLGRYRELDNGQPVNAADSYPFSDGPKSWITGIEMIHTIANSPQAHGCYAKHLFSFIHGRNPLETDHPYLEMLTESSLQGASTTDLLLETVLSPRFYRRGQ